MSKISDHLDIIFIVGISGSGKANALLHLINYHLDTDKIYLYAKDIYETKYQLLTNKELIKKMLVVMSKKLLLNTQDIWMIFMKILKTTTQIGYAKC